jgi:MerR family copper efflux transcriptional regulator
MTKMRAVYQKKLEDTKVQLVKLEQLHHELAQSLVYLDTCDVCEPDRLLSTCNVCNHHDCEPSDVPELVAGFRTKKVQ